MGIGDAIQHALGLGVSGIGQVAQGLGLAKAPQPMGMFGAPAQPQDASLSDVGPLQQLALRFQNAVASGEGQGPAAASGALRQQRVQANQQRLQAFNQGIDLLQQFDGIRDKASPEDYDRIDGLLKKRFGELAGGSAGDADSFYDTFMGGRAGHNATLLEMAKTDPGAQQIIATGGGVGELRKYFSSPEKLHEAIQKADQGPQGMEEIRRRFGELFSSSDPEERQKAEALRLPTGRFDLSQVRSAFPNLLNQSQWAIAERNEPDLAASGFDTPADLVKAREAGMNSDLRRKEKAAELSQQADNSRALAEQKFGYDKQLQELKNQGLTDRKKAQTGKIMQYQWQAARYATRMQNSNGIFEKLLNQGYDRTSKLSGLESMMPNAVRSSQRQQQDQAERDFVNAVLRDESGAVINPSEFENTRLQYFPQMGDSEQTVKQKAANRQQVIDAMRAEASDAWDRTHGAADLNATHGGAAPTGGAESQIVKKQYSKSRNQTRIIYSDGREEIVDGLR